MAKHIFRDESQDDYDKIAGMSDEDLDRLMGAGPAQRSESFEELEPGSRVSGTVVDIQGEEVLVELDGKTLGVIDAGEFEGDQLPTVGSSIAAEFVQYDPEKDACILSTRTVRTEVAWEQLRVGTVVEGVVTGTNKGGLDLDIKGVRAFVPISQIERGRVEDTAPFVGRKLTCEVIRIDRAEHNLLVSRRVVLDREYEVERQRVIATIEEGSVVKGRVTRVTEHGAFVDVGGVDGLLHASKIKERFGAGREGEALRNGQLIEVEITRVDRDRGRLALDFISAGEDPWEDAIGDYAEGDVVHGWISRRSEAGGYVLSLEEGLEAVIPQEICAGLSAEIQVGSIVKGRVREIDRAGRRVIVEPFD